MKRILIFSTAYNPFIGGAEVAVKEITSRLPGYEFVMLTARLDVKLPIVEKIGNIEVRRIGKGDKWDKLRLILQGPKAAQQLKKFDAVWSIMASYAGFAALRFKKQNQSVPFLLTLQEGDSRAHIYSRVWFVWPWFVQIFKRADRIQAISTYLAKWAKSLGVKCPVEVVPNGVEVGKFITSSSAREVGLTRTVITVSRLVKKNAVSDLIQAMKFLPEDIHLQIAGTGELEPQLRRLTQAFGLEKRVHFLGNISQQDLPKYLWKSDVFCRPSLSEGLGISFLEAMAASVPIVATPVGGIPDFLIDGETGLFCKVGDPADIAKQIKRLLDDQSLANKIRMNGQKLVSEKYSWDKIAGQIQTIFHNLSESSPNLSKSLL